MSLFWQNLHISPVGLCEERIAGRFITTPANTWSNIAYIIIGILILFRFRKEIKSKPYLTAIPIITILIGAASFLYHASYSEELLILDFFGIFLLLSFLITLNVRRMLRIKKVFFWLIFVFLNLLSYFFVLILGNLHGLEITAALFIILIALELLIRKKAHDVSDYSFFVLFFFFNLTGLLFWITDRSGLLCNPQNHFFQLHVLWHMFSAVSILFLFKHYVAVFYQSL